VILSDLLDPAARARGHEVMLVEVLDSFEVDPPDLADLDLEDEETGELVALSPGGAAAAYRAALARHRDAVDEGAADLGAAVLRVSTADAFDDVVASALRQGIVRAGGPR
jgi:hypothetical protein